MKIILFALGIILISFWLTFIVSVGVSVGIKTAYKDFSESGGKEGN